MKTAALWIDINTLAIRWDMSNRNADRIARLNSFRRFKTGTAVNAGVKYWLPDVLKHEKFM